MILTPNKLNHGKCPKCNVLHNSWDGVPVHAIGARYFYQMKCQNPECGAPLLVRVRVTFDVELEPDYE